MIPAAGPIPFFVYFYDSADRVLESHPVALWEVQATVTPDENPRTYVEPLISGGEDIVSAMEYSRRVKGCKVYIIRAGEWDRATSTWF